MMVTDKRTETRLRGIIPFSFFLFPSASSLSFYLSPIEIRNQLIPGLTSPPPTPSPDLEHLANRHHSSVPNFLVAGVKREGRWEEKRGGGGGGEERKGGRVPLPFTSPLPVFPFHFPPRLRLLRRLQFVAMVCPGVRHL